jgi:hypothetical protein
MRSDLRGAQRLGPAVGAALAATLLGCATAPSQPASVTTCPTRACPQGTMPLFWSSEEPPFLAEALGEVQVDASEAIGPGFGPASREQLLEALARKARGLGAEAIVQVQVEEAAPVREPDPAASLTQLSPPPQGSARGVAIRRLGARP